MSGDRTLRERVATAFEYRVVHPLRRRRTELVDERVPRAAERLYRLADGLSALPFRGERNPLPPPRRLGERTSDTLDDLAAYTQLPRPVLERLLTEREPVSFRSEWHASPQELRAGHFFHLASKAYIFGNAVHFADDGFAERWVLPHVPPGGRVLDFGAGTGELALQLAAHGVRVAASELNALQRDFLRFRVERHGLGDAIEVLDWWRPLPAGAFDAIVAVDVLEHLDDAGAVLERQLVPALRSDGVLVENTPFAINASNPMHHDDFGLVPYLERRGFREVDRDEADTRVWSRAARAARERGDAARPRA